MQNPEEINTDEGVKNESPRQMPGDLEMERAEEEAKARLRNCCPFLADRHFGKDLITAYVEYTDKEREVLLAVNELANQVGEVCRGGLEEFLDEYHYESGSPVEDEIRRCLDKRGLVNPRFKLAFGWEAQEFLQKAGLERELLQSYSPYGLDPGEGILVFQLPYPVAIWWDKDLEGLRGKKPYSRIAWRKAYDRIIWPIRGVLDTLPEELGIELFRVNPGCVHDPRSWYYVYVVRKVDAS